MDFRKQKESLPIFSAKEKLIEEIHQNETLIIIGETGSGKTTRKSEIIFKGKIAITQPRRVAATSVAKRVAEEMQVKLGELVGYSVRFDELCNFKTELKYMTDGMLLRELLSNSNLDSYSVIILDEAHERTLRTDILFGILKSIQKKRRNSKNPLKLLIMSATLNADKFSEYFDVAKVVYVAGRQFPVKVFYTAEPQSDYLDAVVQTIFQLHCDHANGDILAFLSGQEEIEAVQSILLENEKYCPIGTRKLVICPIFASLPAHQQAKVFAPAPSNCRKIILATNIAETSITIPNVKHVIDPGVAKMRTFNPKTGMESLSISPISKSSSKQRAGRAGREGPGNCYRLFTEQTFNELEEETAPEIKRSNLSNVILTMKASGIEDIVNFDYLDKPPRESLKRALEELFILGALNEKGELTKCGKQMAEFPLIPTLSKVLIKSVEYHCTCEVISIISLLSVDNLFFASVDQREIAALARQAYVDKSGDHLTLLNLFKAYNEAENKASWCKEHFIHHRSMKQVLDIRNQLEDLCKRHKIPVESKSEYEVILKCFLSGCFQQVALLQLDNSYKTMTTNQIVHIHPSSAMFGKKADCLLFNELTVTTRNYLRGISKIEANWLPECIPAFFHTTK